MTPSRNAPFQNRSSRRKEAPYFLWFEPRHLGCYGVLKAGEFQIGKRVEGFLRAVLYFPA